MTAPALRYEAVSVGYGSERPPVVRDVSLALGPGERVALLGLNGSGKTTLLLATVGLLPHDGAIEVGGARLGGGTVAAIRARLGMVFNVPDDQLLFPRVVDDVAFGPLRDGVDAPEAARRARDTLARLGVADLAQAPVASLSHGQRQRVALAGALVTGPSLLLLDEPSSGLDPPAARALARTLVGLEAATLIASHDLDFVRRACTRFVLLDGGRVVADTDDLASIERRWDRVPP